LLGTPVPPEVDAQEWQPFFKMPVLLLMLITLLNDGTLIAIGYDNVETSQFPEEWNLPVRFFISCTLALVALGSSLLILWGALTSWTPNSWFQVLAITPPGKGLQYGEVTCMIYLKVALSDFLTLFSCRTGERFFWTRLPSAVLMIAASIALLSSSLIGAFLPHGRLDDQAILGIGITTIYVWIYCIIWFIIQDVVKVAAYWFLRKTHLFGYGRKFMATTEENVAGEPEAIPLKEREKQTA
jgi:H+-transporting ATPase